jgi:hypothetical protein
VVTEMSAFGYVWYPVQLLDQDPNAGRTAFFPLMAQAPHRLPFLFLAKHRFDIVQTLALSFSPFNGRVVLCRPH